MAKTTFTADTEGNNVRFTLSTGSIPTSGICDIKAVYPAAVAETAALLYFNSQEQNGNNPEHIGNCDLMYANIENVDVSDDINLSFTHLLPMLRFCLKNDDAGEDININKITIRSSNTVNNFYTALSYDMHNGISLYNSANTISLSCVNSTIARNGGIGNYYMMLAGNTVNDDSDNFIVSIDFTKDGTSGIQEFTIPRGYTSGSFLESPFTGGFRYYFRLLVTDPNIHELTEDGIRYSLNLDTKEGRVVGYTGSSAAVNIKEAVTYNTDTYSIISIASNVFANATISEVNIPASVTGIEDGAFFNSSLTAAYFASGSTLQGIGNNVFKYCSSLGSINIPATVIGIGEGAFSVSALTSISFDSTPQIAIIGDYAFESCPITYISIPPSVTEIGNSAFENCSNLGAIVFESGSGLETIGERAFANCDLLTSLTLPNQVTTIGSGAFINCIGLTIISIPASVTYIGGFAFQDSALTNIYLHCTVPPALGTEIFKGRHEVTIQIPVGLPDYNAYNNEFNVPLKGWIHASPGIPPVSIASGVTVKLNQLSGATGEVSIIADLP
jgi:hypothetical protein